MLDLEGGLDQEDVLVMLSQEAVNVVDHLQVFDGCMESLHVNPFHTVKEHHHAASNHRGGGGGGTSK